MAFTHCDVRSLENDVAIRRQWAVVESKHHLMIVERQCLLILHATDVIELFGTDRNHSARPKCIGIAGTRCGKDRAADPDESNRAENDVKGVRLVEKTKRMGHLFFSDAATRALPSNCQPTRPYILPRIVKLGHIPRPMAHCAPDGLNCKCLLLTQSGHWLVSSHAPFGVLPRVDTISGPEPRGD